MTKNKTAEQLLEAHYDAFGDALRDLIAKYGELFTKDLEEGELPPDALYLAWLETSAALVAEGWDLAELIEELNGEEEGNE